MADLDRAFLDQQRELLREIRDEIRSSNHSGQAGGFGMHGNRPPQSVGSGAAFVRAQAAADQLLSGQFATMGWANAYKSQIQSSLINDFSGAMGLRRGPSSMYQFEYQQAAYDLSVNRVAGFPAAVLAPGYSSSTNALAMEIQGASNRFLRFGDAGTGPGGVGASFTASSQLARSLNTMAAGDLRLSGGDYKTIMQTGAASGQFDFSTSLGDMKAKFVELKDVISDLTRVTRASVGEVGNFMGSLRQSGVTSVSEQGRITEGVALNARLAGLSFNEVASGSLGAIQSGLSAGIGPAASAASYGSNIALARNLSRSGGISGNLMAAVGGAAGFAGSVTAMQQGLMASNGGLLSAAAGGRGGFLNGAMAGLSGIRSLDDMVSFAANRNDIAGSLGAGAMDALTDSYVAQVATTMGMPVGQNAAYIAAMSQGMDPSAAQAFGMSYSPAGRRARAAGKYGFAGAQRSAAAMANYDDYYASTTIPGKLRGLTAGMSQLGASAEAGIANFLSPGQGGYLGGRFGGSLDRDTQAIALGARANVIDAAALSDALTSGAATSGDPGASVAFAGSGKYTAAGTLIGGTIGFGIAGTIGTPLLVGDIAVAAGGLAVGAGIGAGIGSWADGLAGNAAEQIKGGEAANYIAFRDAVAHSSAARGRELANSAAGRAIMSSAAFRALASRADRTNLSVAEARAMSSAVAGMGASQADVMSLAKASGVDIQLPTSWGGVASDATANPLLRRVMSGVNGASMATGQAQSALAAFMGGSPEGQMQLAAAGFGGKDIDAIRSGLSGLSASEQSELRSSLISSSRSAGSVAANRAMGGIADSLGAILDQAEGVGGINGIAAARAELDATSGDRRKLLGFSSGNGLAALRSVIGQFDPALLKSLSVESADSLARLSTDNIATKYGLDKDKVAEIRQNSRGDAGKFQQLIEFQLMSGLTTGQSPEKVISSAAAINLQAARVLTALAGKVGLTEGEAKK